MYRRHIATQVWASKWHLLGCDFIGLNDVAELLHWNVIKTGLRTIRAVVPTLAAVNPRAADLAWLRLVATDQFPRLWIDVVDEIPIFNHRPDVLDFAMIFGL